MGAIISDNNFPAAQWKMEPTQSNGTQVHYAIAGNNAVPCDHWFDVMFYIELNETAAR